MLILLTSFAATIVVFKQIVTSHTSRHTPIIMLIGLNHCSDKSSLKPGKMDSCESVIF